MNRIKMKKKNLGTMLREVVWGDVSYTATIDSTKISAVIPQKRLKKDGTIPKKIVELLRKPCLLSKRQLLVFFGIHVTYKPLLPPSRTLELAA